MILFVLFMSVMYYHTIEYIEINRFYKILSFLIAYYTGLIAGTYFKND